MCNITSLNNMLPEEIKFKGQAEVKSFDQYQELYKEFVNFYKITDKVSIESHNIQS